MKKNNNTRLIEKISSISSGNEAETGPWLQASGVSVTSQLLHASSKKASRKTVAGAEGRLFSTAFHVHFSDATHVALFFAHNEYYAEPISNW